MSRFQAFSRRLQVNGPSLAPLQLVDDILGVLHARLQGRALGHAKAVAVAEGGCVYGSTTFGPNGVDVQVKGQPVFGRGESLRIDTLCVQRGASAGEMKNAWEAVQERLAAQGLAVTPLASATRAGARYGSSVASLLSSLLVLKPCCLVPVLWSLSGGTLTAMGILQPLEAYRPAFMLVSAALLTLAWHKLYWRQPRFDVIGADVSLRNSRILLGIASLVFVLSVTAPLIWPDAYARGAAYLGSLCRVQLGRPR